MNEYARFFIAAFVLMILAGIIVKGTVPRGSLMPSVEAKPGLIYSPKSNTASAVVTGYVLNGGKENERGQNKTEPPLMKQAKMTKTVKQSAAIEKVPSLIVDEPNLFMVESIIEKSDKSFTLNKSKDIKGILVELLTLTPYKGDQILKFRVSNNTDKYFIPQSAGLVGSQSRLLFRQVINSHEKADGYIVFSGKGSSLTFSLAESGGGYRKFNIILN